MRSMFFNSMLVDGAYDRAYGAEEFAEYFSMFIGNGVFVNPMNQLQVVAETGLSVTIKRGACFIDGYLGIIDEDVTKTITANTGTQKENVCIVAKLKRSDRTITLEVEQNRTDMLPVVNSDVHELVLATIQLSVGQSVISNSNITDRRPDKQYCGYVAGVVDQIDTTDIFKQMETAFDEWFQNVKDTLSSDAAGNLQNQLTELKDRVDVVEPDYEAHKIRRPKDADFLYKKSDAELIKEMFNHKAHVVGYTNYLQTAIDHIMFQKAGITTSSDLNMIFPTQEGIVELYQMIYNRLWSTSVIGLEVTLNEYISVSGNTNSKVIELGSVNGSGLLKSAFDKANDSITRGYRKYGYTFVPVHAISWSTDYYQNGQQNMGDYIARFYCDDVYNLKTVGLGGFSDSPANWYVKFYNIGTSAIVLHDIRIVGILLPKYFPQKTMQEFVDDNYLNEFKQ